MPCAARRFSKQQELPMYDILFMIFSLIIAGEDFLQPRKTSTNAYPRQLAWH
jgi:hypothetical protein